MDKKDGNLTEKELYKLFNHIKITESEFDDMKEEVSTMQKERIKKVLNKRIKGKKHLKILKYSSTAAAITLACLIGIGTIAPASATNIPVLGSIVQTLNEKMGHHGDYAEYAEYSQIVNNSVTDQGITVTINEVLADDARLIISYTIKSDKKFRDSEIFTLGSCKINGKEFSGHGSAMGDYLDDYTYVGSEERNVPLLQLPEKFNVDIKISEIIDIKGKWNFSFSVSKEEIAKKSTIFKPNKQILFPDSVATVDKVVFSPIGTYIYISGNYKDKDTRSPHRGILDYDYWLAFDEHGVELVATGMGGGSSDGEKFNSEMHYAKVKDIPQYLTILPCKITPSGGGGVSEDGKVLTYEGKKATEVSTVLDGKYPKELSQGKFGKLIIKEVTTKDDKTTIKFTAEGKAPYFQASKLYLKDEQGEDLLVRNNALRRDAQNPSDFTLELAALDPNKQYRICTTLFDNVELGEEFKIELNK